MLNLTALEICGGAGGQALGLEQAGFEHAAIAEIDPDACNTLRANRPAWKIIEGDVRDLDGTQFRGVDLLAGGVPCQPFSVGGKQLGHQDERDLFPEALRLAGEIMPGAVMLENVAGLAEPKFASWRAWVRGCLEDLGYTVWWQQVLASQFGVPQLRPRMVLIALQAAAAARFQWPSEVTTPTTAGLAVFDLMTAKGWPWAAKWALERCNKIAPTIVGGSKKHGGPDLGPTRARAAWLALGVNGSSIAEQAPGPDAPENHVPRLTVRMVARLQGFPDSWAITGRKTAAYRQVGNAFPPPVARAFGAAIGRALQG